MKKIIIIFAILALFGPIFATVLEQDLELENHRELFRILKRGRRRRCNAEAEAETETAEAAQVRAQAAARAQARAQAAAEAEHKQ